MLYRSQTMILQIILVLCFGVIGGLLYYNLVMIQQGDAKIIKSIDTLDVECPAAPKCPDLSNPITKDDLQDVKNPSCASTQEIVEAIFPGRSVASSMGKYFDIRPNEEYELLPSYSPYDSSLPYDGNMMMDLPLRAGNVNIPQNHIDNTLDGDHMNTSSQESLNGVNDERNLDARMNRGLTAISNMTQNKNNGANSTRSKAPNSMMNNSSMNMEMTSTMKANNRSRPRNLNPAQRRTMNNGVYE
jgi:hypothetical protein